MADSGYWQPHTEPSATDGAATSANNLSLPRLRSRLRSQYVPENSDATNKRSKRSRNVDTVTPSREKKRGRPSNTSQRGKDNNAASIKAQELDVAIITEPYFDFTTEEANGIRTTLELKFEDELLDPATTEQTSKLHFRDQIHFSEGVFKLWCEDNVALEWLHNAVADLTSPITGTKLVVKKQAEICTRMLCKLFIPDFDREIGKLRKLLALHNPFVNINLWSLARTERHIERERPGIHLYLLIPKHEVDVLRKQNGRLYWHFGNVYVQFLESESGEAGRNVRTDTCALPNVAYDLSPCRLTIDVDTDPPPTTREEESLPEVEKNKKATRSRSCC